MLGVLLLNVITKQSLLSISLLCAIPSLQLYIALVGFALTTTRAHCKQGQTDASASQGTRVSNDNLSANSIHIQVAIHLKYVLLVLLRTFGTLITSTKVFSLIICKTL